MPPSVETLERLEIELPVYAGASHPFGFSQRPKFYKEISESAEGKTARTSFFEQTLVGLYLALDRPVPYAFRTANNEIRSMDAGCIKFLSNRRDPEAEIIRDSEGYVVAVRPLPPLLLRYSAIQGRLIQPFSGLVGLKLPFDLASPIDERRRVVSESVVRDGASVFRRSVLEAWRRRCPVSDVTVEAVLDAAHIFPYLGVATNDLRNAILLRSDIHVLFDASLLSLEYKDAALFVRTSRSLSSTIYAAYDGKNIELPADVLCRPDRAVISYRFKEFIKRESSLL